MPDKVDQDELLKDLLERVNRHDLEIEAITELLEDIGPGGPIHWEHLTNPLKARLLERVSDFVLFLDRTYLRHVQRYHLKPCWWQHPDVVWQLTALWAAFTSVYTPSVRPGSHHAQFHEHVLWPILERIAANGSMGQCTSSAHEPPDIEPIQTTPELLKQIDAWKGSGNDEQPTLEEAAGAGADGDRVPDELHTEHDGATHTEPGSDE